MEVPGRSNTWERVSKFDAGWNHPFTNILANGSWSYRVSVGPSFHFGKNILQK